MYFAIAIIRLSKMTLLGKNCKFKTLYLEKYLCDKSEFSETIYLRSYFEMQENSAF